MVQEKTALVWVKTTGFRLNEATAETGNSQPISPERGHRRNRKQPAERRRNKEGETEGLSVSSFAFAASAAPASPALLALAAADTGLFISRDGCRSWQRAPGPIGELPMLAVCLAPSSGSGKRALLGTTGGIAYSHDLSEWTLARLPQDGIDSISMVASPNFAEDGILFTGTLDYGVLHSLDRGSSWQARHYGLLDLRVFVTAISPLFRQDQTVLAGTLTGIFFSPNGGLAWREATVPDEDDPVLCMAFSPDYEHDSLIAAGTEAGMLLKSLDAGRTWIYMETPCAGKSINALTFLPQVDSDPLMILGAANLIYVSASGHPCWHVWDTGAIVLTLASCATGARHSFVLAGLKDNGIWRGEPEIASHPKPAMDGNRTDKEGEA